VKTTPLGNDPTGNVTAGSLKIEGLVTECLLGREFKEHLQKFHGRTLHLDVPGSEQQMLCSMICDTAASSEKDNGRASIHMFHTLIPYGPYGTIWNIYILCSS
jgi:hypothetical protein